MHKLSNVVLLGGIAVGKGMTTRRLQNEFGTTMVTIGMGDLIRGILRFDKFFEQRYGESINSGNLLPDDPTNVIANDARVRGVSSGCRRILWEGYFRTESQVIYALDQGWITPEGTLFIDMHASDDTLRRRHEDRLKRKPDGPRFDENSFIKRLGIFHKNHPSVRRALMTRNFLVPEIDADRDLGIVASEIVEATRSLWRSDQIKFTHEPQIHEVFRSPHTPLSGLNPRQRLARANARQNRASAF